MFEFQALPLQNEVLFKEGTFPLTDRMVKKTLAVMSFRNAFDDALDSGEETRLVGAGFPPDLIPVMQLWKDHGPDILGTFAHPEKLNLYKVTALFNLKLFEEVARLKGVEFPRILVQYYDTIPLERTVQNPFQINKFGSGFDLFGVQNETSSSRGITKDEVMSRVKLFRDEQASIALDLINQLGGDLLSQELSSRKLPPHTCSNTELFKIVENGFRGRLEFIARVMEDLRISSRETIPLSRFLMEFQREFSGRFFGGSFDSTPAEERYGYKVALLSQNKKYLDLLRSSIDLLIKSRGVSLLTGAISPWEELAVLTEEGKRLFLTKNDEEELMILNENYEGSAISLEGANHFLQSALPTARLESIALIAGGRTLHMGSEHGAREPVLKSLGVTGEALEYAAQLQIGEDKEHGNGLLMLPNEHKSISFLLAYLLFGKMRVKDMIATIIGRESQPRVVSIAELKKEAARAVVTDALSANSDIALFNEEPRGGWLSY